MVVEGEINILFYSKYSILSAMTGTEKYLKLILKSKTLSGEEEVV
jgi:hypothetical protein